MILLPFLSLPFIFVGGLFALACYTIYGVANGRELTIVGKLYLGITLGMLIVNIFGIK